MDDDFDDVPRESLKALADAARDTAKADYVARERASRQVLEEAGVKVGSVVYLEWAYDPRYGSGDGQHTGRVTRMDGGFLYVASSMRSVGNLYIPIASIKTIRVDEQLSANPFVRAG